MWELNFFTIYSIWWSLFILIEILEECGFVLELNLIMIWESLVLLDICPADWSNGIKNGWPPDVSLLNIIESFVASSDKVVNVLYISHSTVGSPIGGNLELSLLWGTVLSETLPVYDERHVATILSEES